MAKTNRRPVDRLERQQRLEHRTQRHSDDDQGLIDTRNWQEFVESDLDEPLDLYEE